MTNLLSLAERCEQATEAPPHSWNFDIHEALGNCVHRETESYFIEDGNDYDSGFTCKACHKDTHGFRVPNYTASLDAAMTLVPEGCGDMTLDIANGRAAVQIFSGRKQEAEGQAIAATAALALCAAALRARAA